MPRVWLDDEFHSHPKVIGAGLEAAGLFARALSYCGAYLTDGFVPGEWVDVVAAKHKKAPARLVEVGLWERAPGGYLIPDYLDYNDSKDEVLRFRAERAKSGRKGARRRWGGGKQQKPLFEEGEGDSNSYGNSDDESHSSSHGSEMAGAMARGRAPRDDGKTMARDRAASTTTNTPTPEEQEDLASEAERSGATAANGLPFEKERLTIELLAAIGDAADEGTPQIVRRFAARLPEGSLAKVLESVLQSKARNRARYVVGALKDELELVEPRSRSATLRKDPEAWVREVGWKMPADVFEEALVEVVPGDQERDEDARIGLRELAANLREGA